MSANGASHQRKGVLMTPMPTKPGSLSALQLRLWRAVLRAEALLAQAEGEPLATQLKVLNSVSQVCLAYLSSIKSHEYNTHPVRQ
jgi:hypothetical protein